MEVLADKGLGTTRRINKRVEGREFYEEQCLLWSFADG